MKSIIFFVAVLALTQGHEMFSFRHEPPPPGPADARAATPIISTFTQRQDHFDPSNQNTWQMKYAENNQYFRTGGAMFVFLGGEGPMGGAGFVQGGQMYQMAGYNKATLYQLEHRYYGESQPTEDLSVENLKYLTIEQVLEDIAQFIIQTKQNNATLADSKVVVFGGSYSANLALWMRQQYPHLVHAAVSSSGPVHAKVDFNEYHDVVQENLGVECASVITRGIEEIQRLLSVGEVAKVKKDINWCWSLDVTNRFSVEAFFRTLSSNFGGKLQYGNSLTVPKICSVLQNSTLLTDYERLTAYLKGPSCKSLLVNMNRTAPYADSGRTWKYQTCTQMGFFQTSWTSTSLYSRTISTDLYQKSCLDTFGPTFTAEFTAAGVAATNARYGGLKPNVTRVISLHGSLDPWSGLGLKSDELSKDAPVFVINGFSHCADMYELSSKDPINMFNAKLAVRHNIAEWLKMP